MPTKRTPLWKGNKHHTPSYIAENFRYQNGHIYFTQVRPGRSLHRPAGSTSCKDQYRRVNINKVNYLVHRVIWCLCTGKWPEHKIEHCNGNHEDNRFENLRIRKSKKES